ncbi:MAG: hypothetical protein GDA36_06410 [Rhodobacteraceae bacterium]|nr:hypothetical protein [Paracoccaceae bacterium]
MILPDDPDVHFSADTQVRWVRNGTKRTPVYKIKSNGFARPDEEGFIDRVYTGTCQPGREPPEFDTMIKGAVRAGIGRQGLCLQGPSARLPP